MRAAAVQFAVQATNKLQISDLIWFGLVGPALHWTPLHRVVSVEFVGVSEHFFARMLSVEIL